MFSPLISPWSPNQLSATFTYQDSAHSCKAIIDSGTEASFLDYSTAKSWGIPAISLSSPVNVWGLSGQPVATITHTTPCVSFAVSGNHRESVVHSLSFRGIIGWTSTTLRWIGPAVRLCLRASLVMRAVLVVPLPLCLLCYRLRQLISPGVPAEYLDLRLVFSRSRTTSLPPHRPFDSAIDVLPGTSPPRGHLFSLSGPEHSGIHHSRTNLPLVFPCWHWVLLR